MGTYGSVWSNGVWGYGGASACTYPLSGLSGGLVLFDLGSRGEPVKRLVWAELFRYWRY
jgi:hypothetical protein